MLPVLAMLAAAAIQAHASSQAARRQQAAAREAQQRQLQARNEATDAAMKRVQDFDPGQRQQQQDQIQQELTSGYEQQVQGPQLTAQGVQVGSSLPDAAGGADYTAAKARETAKSQASLRALAALMGRTGSAGELRRREAVGIGDTAGQIGRISTGADNIAGIDQIGIQAAGQVSPAAQIASAALNAYGMNGVATSGLGGAKALPTTGDFARMDRAAAWLK